MSKSREYEASRRLFLGSLQYAIYESYRLLCCFNFIVTTRDSLFLAVPDSVYDVVCTCVGFVSLVDLFFLAILK